MNRETIYRQDVLDLAKKGVLISNGNYENVCKAINELPPVNPQPCEDAISRQAVLDGLASIAKAKAKSDAQKSLMGRVMFFTERLPPVTPQPKTGHWITTQEVCRFLVDYMDILEQIQEPKTGHWIEKDGFDGDTYYDCSECGESWTTIEGNPWNNGMKYCPNCGAKMIESQERSDKE